MHIDVTLPLLVFGGPYSNLRALAALRERADELGIPPSQTICTGDVVAYCAEPEETTQAMRDWGCRVIAGNCEEQLAEASDNCACGFEEGTECDTLAKGWYPFANARMSAESRAWMAELPKTITLNAGGLTFRVIHGGVGVINRFVFASQRDVLAEEMQQANADVVIAGHAGVPFIEKIGRGVWFDPGVIGMPANDGTPDVWYGLIRRRRRPHRAVHAPAGLRPPRRRRRHAPLRPCQRLRTYAGDGPVAEPRRIPAGRARRQRSSPAPAYAAHSGSAARSRNLGRNKVTAALRRCDGEAGPIVIPGKRSALSGNDRYPCGGIRRGFEKLVAEAKPQILFLGLHLFLRDRRIVGAEANSREQGGQRHGGAHAGIVRDHAHRCADANKRREMGHVLVHQAETSR